MSWKVGDRVVIGGHSGTVTNVYAGVPWVDMDDADQPEPQATAQPVVMTDDPRDYYAGDTVWNAWVRASIAEGAARAMCIKYAFRMGAKGGEAGKVSDARKLLWYAEKLHGLVSASLVE